MSTKTKALAIKKALQELGLQVKSVRKSRSTPSFEIVLPNIKLTEDTESELAEYLYQKGLIKKSYLDGKPIYWVLFFNF